MKRLIRNFTATTIQPRREFEYDYAYDIEEMLRQMGGSHFASAGDWNIDHFGLDLAYWKMVAEIVGYVDAGISVFGLLINILHLIILTRKELRSNVVYVIMIGISLCDLLSFLKPITSVILDNGNFYHIYKECDTEKMKKRSYYHTLTIWVLDGIQTTGRASSALLSLAMTSLRSFTVKFSMSSYVPMLMKGRNGVFTVILICATCTFWKCYFYSQKSIVALRERCRLYMYNRYYLKTRSSTEALMKLVDGYFEVGLTVAYIIVTSILLIEVGRAHRRRKNLGSEKAENSTTKLVFWMSVCFFVSHIFFGGYYLIDTLVFRSVYGYEKLETVLRELAPLFQIVLTLNSAVHCLICLMMSAQYRSTAKRVFCRKEETMAKKVEFVGPPSTSSVNTWQSTDGKHM